MDKLIKIHRNNEQIDFKAIWKDGLFVFDSNVLLDLYRLPSSAQKDLLRILKNEDFNKRIWIGFQVLIEFLNNRYEAISDQKNKFTDVRKLIDDTLEQYDDIINNLNSELSKLKLKQRHSLIDPDKFINESKTKKAVKFLHDFTKNLEGLEKKQSDVNDDDEIKDVVLEIFKNKIGASFDKKRLEEIYKEGEKRYDKKIPPGFKDAKKPGSHLYEDKEYVRKFGDLILWFEIIEKAKADKLKYVVLVTGDVKEDWWFEKRGRKLGPRLELLNEIYDNAEELDTFHIYDTSSFLKYAQKELDNRIKDSSINEAKELIEQSKENRLQMEAGYADVVELLKKVSGKFERIKLGIGKSVKGLPLLKIDNAQVYTALLELFSNVSHHSSNGYVGVQAKIESNLIVLKFKNLIRTEAINQTPLFMGKGLEVMKANFAKENIDCHTYSGGSTEEELKNYCQKHQLKQVHFLGRFPMEETSEIVNFCDVSMVSFKDLPILYTNSPNKLFDSLSAGKPIIVNSAGWTKDMVEKHNCGFYVNPNVAQELVDKILLLKRNPEIVKEMGRKSRTLAETVYDKSILCKQFVETVENTYKNL